MPSYVTAKKNTEYIFYISLVSQSNTKLLQANPTLAAGDIKVSTDGSAEGNVSTLPVVTPAGSKRVKVTVSASEMNGDNIQVTFSDAAGAEWCDITLNIPTTATQIDNLVRSTTPANTLDVAASGGVTSENMVSEPPTVEEIDEELTTNHDAGSWGAGEIVVLPVMQGEVYSAVAVQDKEVKIVKGDTPRIIFDLEENYTGWTVWFAAKEKMSDTSYAIDLREVTWSDASLGQGYIDLSASDTNIIGKFFAELELKQGAQRLTAMKYTLVIIDDVIDA